MICLIKKLAAFAFIILISTFTFSVHAASARSYALIEQKSGRIISGSNYNQQLPMASTTKIMTGLLACESGRLDEIITVPAEAICVEGSSMGLVAGESITLRELVYGLLLESGNDAANVIAFTLGGSVPGFATMMNNKAEELSLPNTQFQNPSGLDAEGHYTTALDLARLGAFAMNNKDFATIVSTKKISISYNGSKNGRSFYNHNRLLGSYDGELGIKTGFTKKSGRCLVSCAEQNGVKLVLCTLDDPNDWEDHRQLLNYGFNTLKCTNVLVSPPQLVANIVGGKGDNAIVTYAPEVLVPLAQGESVRVTMQVNMNRFYYAPVAKGCKLGEIAFYLDGNEIANTDILCCDDVALLPKKLNPIVSLFGSIGKFFKSLFGIK